MRAEQMILTAVTVRDSKINLCEKCKYDVADCPAKNILYGDNIGNDNVIACDAHIEGKKGAVSIDYTKKIIEYLNEKAVTNYRANTEKTRKLIAARTKEGFGIDDFYRVIDNMTAKWKKDPMMSRYLRPETLFGSKFESYLNEKVMLSDEGKISKHTEKSKNVMEEWLNERGKNA